MKKDIHKISNKRLRRLRVKLLIYNVNVEYLPSKLMYVADFQSINYISRSEKSEESLNDVVHTLEMVELKFENNEKEEFAKKTKEDETLKQVVDYLSTGQPSKCNTGDELKHYFKSRNELILEDDLVYFRMRLVVPIKLRNYTIKMLLNTHLGLTKTVAIAKQLFHWACMKKYIESFIESFRV